MLQINQTSAQHEIQLRTEEKSIQFYCVEDDIVKNALISRDGKFTTSKGKVGDPDFSNEFATEGLVDLQVNGFAGVDFNLPNMTPETVDYALAEMALTGVAKFLPTLITNSESNLIRTLTILDAAISDSKLGPHMVLGYHIEGPFLSPLDGYSGAHNSSLMTNASMELIEKLIETTSLPIQLVTIAPEIPGVLELIPNLVDRGIKVSIGHSSANPEQIMAAVDAGLSLCTHLGNGLPQMLHKTENPIFWQLAQEKLTAMFIADGIHVPVPALKVMLRSKGLNRSILTTDAVSAAGRNMSPGQYTLGQIEIELAADKSVRQPGSVNLAGSSVTMEQMLKNILNWFDNSIPEFLHLARRNPMQVLNLGTLQNTAESCAELIEWTSSVKGPQVLKAHIGPYTIHNLN